MTFLLPLLALQLHAESNVIAFKIPPSRRACARVLEAEIVEFPAARPPFQDSRSFLGDMREAKDARYYFYQKKAAQPFAEPRRASWTARPEFPEADETYVIAARPRGGGRFDRLSYAELRGRHELVAFTKIRTPPVLRLVAGIIRHARHFEHYIADRPVDDPQLDFAELISNAPPVVRALRLVDSWRPLNAYEEALQSLLKETLRADPHADGGPADARALAEKLLPGVKEIYRNVPFVSEILLSMFDEN